MNLNEFTPIFTSVINAILFTALPLLVIALIVAVTAWSRKEWALFKSSQPSLADQLSAYAKIAVEAAEQAGLAKLIADKKEYAVKIVIYWLSQVGLNGIDVRLIEAEIERQVREMHLNAQKG